MSDTATGDITLVCYKYGNHEAHRDAMFAAGYVQFPHAAVGDRVLVSLDNGFECLGTVVKVYKNGARRIAHDGHGVGNRSPRSLYRVPQ